MPNPPPEILTFTVPEQYGSLRLDQCLVHFCPERSRSRLQTLIREGHVKVNGTVCTSAKRSPASGSVIELENIPISRFPAASSSCTGSSGSEEATACP